MSPPRVLITNDDGITSPGLRHLARAAADNGLDVVVAAPSQEASGSSSVMSAYTADGRVNIKRHELRDLAGIPAYGVTASPSYIVVLALLSSFGGPPDLVLSGINRGANTGRAVLGSGTVGAAFTAATHDCPAMAVSLDIQASMSEAGGGNALAAEDDIDEARNWRTAAELVRKLLPRLADLPPGAVLNLNVPDLPQEEVRGLRQARLAQFGHVQMAIAESGEDFVRTHIEESRKQVESDSDLGWLAQGYAAVTAIRPVAELGDFTV
jgi:5'/3'-nucleotidase